MSGKKAKRSQSLKNDRPKIKAERQKSQNAIDFSPSPQLKLDVIKEEATLQTEEDEPKDKNPFVAEFPVQHDFNKVCDDIDLEAGTPTPTTPDQRMKSQNMKLMKRSTSTKSGSSKHSTDDSPFVRSMTSEESPTKKNLLKNMRSKMWGN
jgi:hypothetical protein